MDDNNQAKEVKVSVICLTYNHESYIRQCLDGFVMQKTDFAFEAIVHDDASTDHTAEIIREYEEKYPNIIKPIYQDENQFSKNSPFLEIYVLPKLKGKYIALCEGDDYWTDPLKLQKQVDYMEANPQCSLCHHNYFILREGEKTTRMIKIPQNQDLLSIAKDNHVATLSMLFRQTPDPIIPSNFKFRFPVYQHFINLRLAEYGYIHYIDEPMGTYRMSSIGIYSMQSSLTQFKMSMGNLHNMINWYTHGHKNIEVVAVLRKKALKSAKSRIVSAIKKLRILDALYIGWWTFRYIVLDR